LALAPVVCVPRPDDAKAQHERFIETARQFGCDEDEAAFDAKLRVIARPKPKDEPKAPKSKRTQEAVGDGPTPRPRKPARSTVGCFHRRRHRLKLEVGTPRPRERGGHDACVRVFDAHDRASWPVTVQRLQREVELPRLQVGRASCFADATRVAKPNISHRRIRHAPKTRSEWSDNPWRSL